MELLPTIGTPERVTLDVPKNIYIYIYEKSISMKNLFIAKRRIDSLEVPLRRKQILNLSKKRKEVSSLTPLENSVALNGP